MVHVAEMHNNYGYEEADNWLEASLLRAVSHITNLLSYAPGYVRAPGLRAEGCTASYAEVGLAPSDNLSHSPPETFLNGDSKDGGSDSDNQSPSSAVIGQLQDAVTSNKTNERIVVLFHDTNTRTATWHSTYLDELEKAITQNMPGREVRYVSF